MGIATDMKKIGEEIIASYDMRVKAVGELVTDTHKTLDGFAADRKKMGKQQAKDLAAFLNGLSKNVRNLLKEAQGMVGEFEKNRQKISKEQAKSLEDFVNTLTNNINSMLSTFEKNHTKMSKELKQKLAKEIQDIQAQAERILKEADHLVGKFKSDTGQARKAWKDMSVTLAKARRAGFLMPTVKAKEKVTTVGQAIGRGKGKKKPAKKGKSHKQIVPAGV